MTGNDPADDRGDPAVDPSEEPADGSATTSHSSEEGLEETSDAVDPADGGAVGTVGGGADADTGSGYESSGTDTVDEEPAPERPQTGESGSREVVVPMRLYKTITVFSTIIAIVGVLGGFILLDVATDRTQAAASDVSIGLALLGVGMIAGGAATYAFSTRFRTEGMGNAKDDADKESDNG